MKAIVEQRAALRAAPSSTVRRGNEKTTGLDLCERDAIARSNEAGSYERR